MKNPCILIFGVERRWHFLVQALKEMGQNVCIVVEQRQDIIDFTNEIILSTLNFDELEKKVETFCEQKNTFISGTCYLTKSFKDLYLCFSQRRQLPCPSSELITLVNNKQKLNTCLQQRKDLQNYVSRLPQQPLTQLEDLTDFCNQHQRVIVKPIFSSGSRGCEVVTRETCESIWPTLLVNETPYIMEAYQANLIELRWYNMAGLHWIERRIPFEQNSILIAENITPTELNQAEEALILKKMVNFAKKLKIFEYPSHFDLLYDPNDKKLRLIEGSFGRINFRQAKLLYYTNHLKSILRSMQGQHVQQLLTIQGFMGTRYLVSHKTGTIESLPDVKTQPNCFTFYWYRREGETVSSEIKNKDDKLGYLSMHDDTFQGLRQSLKKTAESIESKVVIV